MSLHDIVGMPDGQVPEHWKPIPDPPVDDVVMVDFPDYDLGKVGGYKTADRPHLLAVARFEAAHPGLIEQVLMVEAHLERHGLVAHPRRVAAWLKWIAIISSDLRRWATLTERKVEIAQDIVQQVAESYAEAMQRKEEGRYFGPTGGINRHRSYAVECPYCGRHISARDFYEQDPEKGFRLDAPLRTRIFRHKRPSGDWCFAEGNQVHDPADLVKVEV